MKPRIVIFLNLFDGNHMQSSQGNKNKSLKFTLLELLIIIAIITVLASLLLPSLRQAKMVSHSGICMNNQRQIILNMAMYAQDSNEYFIPYQVNYDGNPWYWTTVFVKTYNVSSMIFLCPGRLDFYYGASSSSPVSNQYLWKNANKYSAGTTVYFWAHPSYGYNSFYIGGDQFGGTGSAKMSSILKPSTTVLIGESAATERSNPAYLEAASSMLAPYPYSPGSGPVARPVHGLKCLIGWIDGHISAVHASVAAGETAVQSLYQADKLGKGSDSKNCWTRNGLRNWP